MGKEIALILILTVPAFGCGEASRAVFELSHVAVQARHLPGNGEEEEGADSQNAQRKTLGDEAPGRTTVLSETPRGPFKIAFCRRGNIYTMNPDGTDVKQLTDTAQRESEPALSPDGRRIAFASARDSIEKEIRLEIYVVNADGSILKRLTNDSCFDSEPCWSPDGKQMALLRGDWEGKPQVYLMNADGSGLKQLTTEPVDPGSLSCSPALP